MARPNKKNANLVEGSAAWEAAQDESKTAGLPTWKLAPTVHVALADLGGQADLLAAESVPVAPAVVFDAADSGRRLSGSDIAQLRELEAVKRAELDQRVADLNGIEPMRRWAWLILLRWVAGESIGLYARQCVSNAIWRAPDWRAVDRMAEYKRLRYGAS